MTANVPEMGGPEEWPGDGDLDVLDGGVLLRERSRLCENVEGSPSLLPRSFCEPFSLSDNGGSTGRRWRSGPELARREPRRRRTASLPRLLATEMSAVPP